MIIFKLISRIGILRISYSDYDIALRWIPQDVTELVNIGSGKGPYMASLDNELIETIQQSKT